MRRLLCLTATLVAAIAPTARAAECPVAPDPAALPTAAELRTMNAVVDRLGARPTGSPAHAAYIAWIRRELRKVPGLTLREQRFTIDRWTARSSALELDTGRRTVSVPVAAPVPYTEATRTGGVQGRLVAIGEKERITAANARGRVVLRPAPAGAVPNSVFQHPLLSWFTHDPRTTIDPKADFPGDFLNYDARVRDLRDAAKAGARAVLFVKDLPRAQLAEHDEPYEGVQWRVPGLFLGADEGARLAAALRGGRRVSARVTLRAAVRRVTTPSLSATIPGASPQRIVVDSHTDGTNALEDNGPVAMIAMARYLAALPASCRPRTIELSFSTAHWYQRVEGGEHRHGGAGVLARRLDAEYDRGLVSSVLVLEHLGALEWEGARRGGGRPGVALRRTGRPAIQFVAVTPSPALIGAVGDVVRGYGMERTIALQGADAPGPTLPVHCSFGGQGTPFNIRLLPTIGVISAPQTLYNPAFGMEGIDFDLMRRQVLGFTELVNRLGPMSQEDVAGEVAAARARRATGGTRPCRETI